VGVERTIGDLRTEVIERVCHGGGGTEAGKGRRGSADEGDVPAGVGVGDRAVASMVSVVRSHGETL
jgi:hypothetical protein